MERTPPDLLNLSVELFRPGVCRDPDEKTEEYDAQGVAEGLEVAVRAERVDCVAVGATVAFDPEMPVQRLEIASHKAVPPETIAPTHRASGGPLPGILFAKLAKLLYINRGV